jgi:hypothetical protein
MNIASFFFNIGLIDIDTCHSQKLLIMASFSDSTYWRARLNTIVNLFNDQIYHNGIAKCLLTTEGLPVVPALLVISATLSEPSNKSVVSSCIRIHNANVVLFGLYWSPARVLRSGAFLNSVAFTYLPTYFSISMLHLHVRMHIT